MFSYFTNSVRSASPWRSKVEEASLHQPAYLDSLPEFARAIAQKLQSEANQLTSGLGVKVFKGLFCSHLYSVPEYLNGPPHRSQQNRLLTLLNCLEALCQWPNPTKFSYTQEASAGFSASRYPTLKSLLESPDSVKAVLVQFAGAKSAQRRDKAANKLWRDMTDAFEALSAPESESQGPDLSELAKLATLKEDSEDNQSFARQLYDALSQHFQPDRCTYNWKSTVINLRLNWWELSKENDTLCFGIFAMISNMDTSDDSATHCHWQDLQICVSKRKQVAFSVPSDSAPSLLGQLEDSQESCLPNAEENLRCSSDTDQTSTSDENEADELCLCLSNRTVVQYMFEYTTDFKLQKSNHPERLFLRNSMGICLDDLIGTGKLGDRMKLLLSFILVRTFWQYCESNWVQDDWSKESVHFMFDMVDGYPNEISIHEPFLQARFSKSDDGGKMRHSTEPSKSLGRKKKSRSAGGPKVRMRTHQYPKLLALGIMLLEIELDRKLESLASRDSEDSDIVNIRHHMATKVLNDQGLWPPKGIWIPVKESIEICIKADTKVLGNIEEDLRDNFYRRVIGPFKAFLTMAWPDADYQKMGSVVIDNAPPSPPSTAQHGMLIDLLQSDEANCDVACSNIVEASSSAARTVARPPLFAGTTLKSTNSVTDTDGSRSQIEATMSADSRPFTSTGWFAKLDDLNDVLKITQRNRDEHSKLVKVAILDTGVQEPYYQNDQSSTKSIKDYKDFVSGDHNIRRDSTGHGTSCVRLLQKVYEHAEIYVGRVFKTKDATPETKEYMKTAIEYAICKAKGWGVDVICLPSGFESEYRPITSAILNAKPSKVLIFAAASNYGNTAGIFFPAWLSRFSDLFCLFSTTAGAKPTCEFNPAPMDSAYNFAILGEDIQLPDTKPLTGTSFSTIIAAGVAAQIIDFSMQPDVRDEIGSNEILRQVDGMSAIFARMSAKENKYHCLTPWTLLDGMTVQEHDEKDIRLAICRTIANALKTRHKSRV